MKFTTILIIGALFAVTTIHCEEASFCWKDTYGRGVGTPLSQCPADMERDPNGALCYPICPPGYTGVGPACWKDCPDNFKSTGAQCDKDSYTRTAGRPLSSCPEGMEKGGLLCYPKCKAGYTGVGPVCWENCPSGTDFALGNLCFSNAHIYGKGCCCIFGKCCHNCKGGYTDDGCTCRKDATVRVRSSYGRGVGQPMGCSADEEKDGGLCYPKCKAGYTGVAFTCWQTCPDGFPDEGVACIKPTFLRGFGTSMMCKNGEQEDAGLCYPFCSTSGNNMSTDYTGVGPVCWSGCPSGWVQCGAACGKTDSDCAGKIIDMVKSTAEMVADIAGFVVGAGPAAKLAKKIEKVAEKVAETAEYAAKLNDLIAKIMEAAQAAGRIITAEDAKAQAQHEIASMMLYQEEKNITTGDLVDTTWDMLAEVDPTGILGAAKAFYYPRCGEM